MKKIIIALLALAASTAWAEEAPKPPEDPPSLMCEPVDDGDDTCKEPEDQDLVSAQLTCQQCWQFCGGPGYCFNCCCLHHC